MGTPLFAVPSLKILLENKYDVSKVVTVPDKKKGRGQVLSFSEVKTFALENKIPVMQPEKLNEPEFIKSIKSLNPDLIIVVAFRILPEELFSIPGSGTFNLHASLLPKYRGAAPINWALINGEKETGVTTFFLKEKVDTGNIILQKKIAIEDEDYAGIIHNKLSLLGAEAVLDTVKLIESGKVITSEQDNNLSTPAPKIFKEDCLVNWNQDVIKIHNFVRGLSPYPSAFTYFENKIVKIYKSKVTDLPVEGQCGEIIIQNKKCFVSSKDKLLEILELKTEGKKKMSALDFINGLDKDKKYFFG